MLNTRSFSDILHGFSEGNQGFQSSTAKNFEYESHVEPTAVADLLLTLNLNLRTRTAAQAYPSKPAGKFFDQPKQHEHPTHPPHHFEPAELAAFENLKCYSPFLCDNFNQPELKRAYRQAVKRTHPDRGGSSESFLRVRKSYQILVALLTKIS